GELTDTAEHVVTVAEEDENFSPVAVDDTAETDEETPVTIDVLGNDTDPEDDDLTVTEATSPDGTVTINDDGTLEFTPNPDFFGEAVINYTITDGNGGIDDARVFVTVNNINDAPVAVDDLDSTDEDTPVTIDVLDNDFDVDGDDLTVIEATSPDGTVTINDDGTIEFTPNADFTGDAVIDYTIEDEEGLTDTAQVTVSVGEVSDPPVAEDDTAETDEDTPVTIDVLGNDSDPDGDDLTVTDATSPDGTVTINEDGTIEFTPNPDFNGEATITYTITDGNGGEDTAEVLVTVNPVNDGPLAEDDNAETPFETPVTVSVLDNDSDPEDDPLTIVDASSPDGEVTINDDGTLTFTPNEGFEGEAQINYTVSDGELEDPAVLFVEVGEEAENFSPVAVDDVDETDEETPVTIDVLGNDTDPEDDDLTVTEATSDDGTVTINDDGTLEFTPNPDFFGEAVIDYTITDGNGGIDDARVFVTVNNINDDPVATDDCVATDLDTPVTIDVLANDSDPDGDELTVISATSPDGDVTFNDDGTIEFTPTPGFTGDAEITYTISDGNGGEDTAVAKVSVGEESTPPVAADDTATTDEDTPVVIDVLANDEDPDGDPLEVIEATSPDGTVTINDDGTIEFTPDPDFNGPTTITYTITDGNGETDTATVDVTVNPVNDGPLAEDDTAETPSEVPVTVAVLDNDSDPEDDPLTIVDASSPDGEVTINEDGTLTFTPNEGFVGDAQVNYTVSDGELEDPAVLFVTVTPPGEVDPIATDDVAETLEDTPVTIDVLDNDVDPNGDALTVKDDASSPDGTVTVNDDGTIEFTPNPDFFGEATITYTVCDPDGNEDTATVTVTVTPVNDSPVAEDDEGRTELETPVTIDVLGNDSDPEGDDLTVIEATSPNGTVEINDDGTLTFTPEDGFFGPTEITYVISDGNGGEDEGTVDVMVNDGIVTGTDGDDLIDGTFDEDPEGDLVDNGDEFLPGEGPEDDIINAGDGNDTVEAGEGNDDVSGGTGDDSINGDVGDDVLDGDEGEDTLLGGEGDDTLNGGSDDDMLDGEDGDDVLNGDEGEDTLLGGEGDDTLNGGADDDTLDGEEGDDVLNGDEGNDTITGGEGNDTVEGGAGDDVIDTSNPTDPLPDLGYPGIFDADEDPEDDRDSVDGGDGNDTISTGDDRDTITGGTGDDVIDAGIDDDIVDGGEGDDRIVGSEGNDSILGGDGNDTIYANNDPDLDADELEIEDDGSNPLGADLVPNNGMDTVDGGAGDDVIFGGDDDDVLRGGSDDDFIDGGIDDDTLNGGSGEDTLIGGQGDDSLMGAQGDDTLEGGIGDDTLRGNTGNDTLRGEDGDDLLDGGEGDDILSGDDGDDTLRGVEGDDVLNGGEGNDLLEGDEGQDTLFGDEGNDTLLGDIGDDSLLGGDGDDLLDGGIDNDTLNGNQGNDTLVGGEGDDSLMGGVGDDSLEGSIGDDTLRGNIGNDSLHAGEGNDLVDGGDGDDVLSGDDGNDTLEGVLGNDTLDGGTGNDSLDGGQGDDSLEGGLGDDTLRGGIGEDSLNAGAGDDSLDGGQGNDVLNGDEGNDTLDGALGDDTLSGGDGDDVILGGSGDDSIDSGAGVDTMTGGADRDVFFNVNAGDVVDGSESGDDFDCLDLTGSKPEGGSQEIVYDPDNAENGVVNYFNADGSDAGQLVFTNIEKVIPCFTPGTLIATPKGERKVEELEVGDRIITRDNGMQEIRWIGRREMSGEELAAKEHLRPILIKEGALGNGLPERDMMVSPQHRVLIANDKTAMYFEEREVLVAAKHLTDMEGIDQVDVSGTTYIHVMFDQHEVILSDGTWTESFQPGDLSLAGVGDASREEILELFPELATREGIEAYAAARKSLKAYEAKLITKKS
ncbi:Ig-like domain-containing protein, partial [Sulfitobacter sp. HNIBRBA2951]|uniref:Ig-like domain-containing protein n=1 Tax=Sulfitobacter aquimarinus TaxID=3158557 RepID=UPI0032DE8C6F